MTDRRPLASVATAAEHYGVSEWTLRRAIWEKRLPYLQVGRQIRLNLDELDALFEHPVAPGTTTAGSLTVTPQRRRRVKPKSEVAAPRPDETG